VTTDLLLELLDRLLGELCPGLGLLQLGGQGLDLLLVALLTLVRLLLSNLCSVSNISKRWAPKPPMSKLFSHYLWQIILGRSNSFFILKLSAFNQECKTSVVFVYLYVYPLILQKIYKLLFTLYSLLIQNLAIVKIA
jgi:hypothetical protein